MGIKVANNAFATLASSITNSATSITLTTGQGARFPSLGAGDYFYATLIDTSNNLEIVKCTARSTDVLTVVRAQESTTARAYSAGDRIEIRLTAATFTDATQGLPSQTGNAGKYLTTDGTDASWATVSVTPTAISDQTNSSTGYFDLPAGTTAQRPGSPGAGMVRFNTTTGVPEWYDPVGGIWLGFYQNINYSIEYLVIAGGGAGGSDGAANAGNGGGGAGGYRSSVTGESSGGGASAESAIIVTANTAYTVTIGAGGAGGFSANQVSGSSSVFGSITATGGGGGGYYTNNSGASGGSGGGGADTASGGSGTTGQGFSGVSGATNRGGGGGGAGATASSQNGGNGVSSSITGSSVARAGGGGASVVSSTGGSGGSGGGGTASNGSVVGGSGTANTGSGGGAGRSGNNSGSGGSGVVIIRYLGSQRGTGGTITSSGGYTIHTFTSSGTFTA